MGSVIFPTLRPILVWWINMGIIRNEMVEAYETTDAICARITEALEQVNGPYIPEWSITFCCNQHSVWYEAAQALSETRFSRGNLPDLVNLCKIMNGWNP